MVAATSRILKNPNPETSKNPFQKPQKPILPFANNR
jgi:hypothetical protein